jgi:hypothetical protein
MKVMNEEKDVFLLTPSIISFLSFAKDVTNVINSNSFLILRLLLVPKINQNKKFISHKFL